MNTQEKIFQKLREIDGSLIGMQSEIIAMAQNPRPQTGSMGPMGVWGGPKPTLADVLAKACEIEKHMKSLWKTLDQYGYSPNN